MNKFYNYIFLLFLFVFVGCYEDDSQVIESRDALHRSSVLTPLIKSITLHNANFDDHIDNTSCFSLVFPYEVNINSNRRTISSIQDLNSIDENDQVQILFPISIVFFDYTQHKVNTTSELSLLTNSCEEKFDIEHNPCLNFDFPIVIKEFNELDGTFETLNLISNEELFQYVDNLHDSDVYEIDYPILLLDSNSDGHVINSNSEFEEAFEASLSGCQ
ncbi:hypothetical protein [Psychroflexus montanilacus]|uniref:hypothetical protein n=1 Tax=Psychroflexus montanilacus TaxID=2873598 RepID=UPI001CCCB45C|nr:hypothetical protein [Psychroflexus montanilacus]MBZ9651637.1 hypothetical protein [Psychroflexus montanilacus]